MIQIAKSSEDKPEIKFRSGRRKGKDKLTEATKELIERYIKYKDDIDNNRKKFKFRSEIYANPVIKNKLKSLQNNKCCFCEAKVDHIAHGDIEHFRPKAAYKQNEEDDYSYPGYFWLAYDWNNLFFSCQLCNQRHKKNLFPLIDESTRMLNYSGSVSTEDKLFIHPSLDNPEDHIVFIEEIPRHLPGSIRGKETIKSLGLDRASLNEDRRESLKNFINLLNIIKLYPDIPELKDSHNAAKTFIRSEIFEKMSPQSEYSSMFKSLYQQKIKSILDD